MPITSRQNRGRPAVLGLWPLALSLALYVLSFPNPLLVGGAGFLSFVSLVPAFAWLEGKRLPTAAIAGAAYGALAYAGISYWLGNYDPSALVLSMSLATFWFALAFALGSITLSLKAPISIISTILLWSAIETARSSGMLAFPYGTLAYALASYRVPLEMASIGGTSLVGLASLTVNVCSYRCVRGLIAMRGRGAEAGRTRPQLTVMLCGLPLVIAVVALIAGGKPDAGQTVVAAPLGQATASPAAGYYRVALVQAGIAKKQSNIDDYNHAFSRLSSLSDESAAFDPALTVWHETAVIPPIEWHLRYRPDRPIYELAATVKAFLSDYPAAVLLGNGWADPDDPLKKIQGNGAILYDGDAPIQHYEKVKLVPFSEYYPLGSALPGLAGWLEGKFGYFWTPGDGPRILESRGARIAAPICFEDSFGPWIAEFDEPDFFVVLTDDSWGRSAALQEQHLSMSIFRAAETGAIVLRSANSGATAAIAQSGAVIGRLEPFKPGALIVDLKLGSHRLTPYERWGKYLPAPILALGAIAALLALISLLTGKPFRIDKKAGV